MNSNNPNNARKYDYPRYNMGSHEIAISETIPENISQEHKTIDFHSRQASKEHLNELISQQINESNQKLISGGTGTRF